MQKTLLTINGLPPEPREAEASFREWAGSWPAGAAHEHTWVFAKTEAQAAAGADYIANCKRSGMRTEERIDLAITLRECYDAEMRHQLRATASPSGGVLA